MIHDAQVWDAPESYSHGFRIAYRLLLPVIARTARHVLTVSKFAKSRLEALRIVPRGKTHVILNGADHMDRITADPSTLHRYRLTEKGYILAIGNLAPHKNLAMLIKAAAARSPGAPDLVVAGGMNSNVFAEAGLSFGNGVRFIGRVRDTELKALYEGALALAFPSLTEGFGLPPVEAMSCGCPVLATTGGAVPEVCGEAAHYVDPNSPADWTSALEQIALDSELRLTLSRHGRERCLVFTWAKAADHLPFFSRLQRVLQTDNW
jgi:glycosyltransferase involved in cell wall biosynthesis